jgi:pullulanase/glycogen debranching enzyme
MVGLGSSRARQRSRPRAGVNFALFAQHAKHVTLCLYDEATDRVTEVLPLRHVP